MISKEIGGGGGISSSYLKQILPTSKDIVKSNIINYNGLKIKLSGTNYQLNPLFNGLIESNSDNQYFWMSYIRMNPLPVEFLIDFGKEIDNICKLSFQSGLSFVNDRNSCYTKDFQILYSSDGDTYHKIYSGTVDNTGEFDFAYTFRPTNIIFGPITARYIKIIITSIYSSSNRTGFSNLRVFVNAKPLVLKESDNNIYGSVNNEITKITTKQEWENMSKDDKLKLIKNISNDDNLDINKIKGLDDISLIINHNNIYYQEEIISYEYDNLLPVITQTTTNQLDSEKFEYYNKTSLLYNNIKFTTDSLDSGCSILFACSDEYYISHVPGFKSKSIKINNPYPHYLQIEFDEVINGVNKFCFNPGAYCINKTTYNQSSSSIDEAYVKDYNLYYSLDGNEWIKICSKSFLPKSCIYSYWSVWQTEVVEFNEISLKFFKFEVTSSRYSIADPRREKDYSMVNFNQVKLYGLKKIIKKI